MAVRTSESYSYRMYGVINRHRAEIVKALQEGRSASAIGDYSWLQQAIRERDVSRDAEFQRRYRRFWVMRFPANEYFPAYFRLLEQNKSGTKADPASICRELRAVSGTLSGKDAIQFSFATKLAHMADPDLPIYDQMVRQFYFLPTPAGDLDFAARLAAYMVSYSFLKTEYQRVIDDGLLAPAMSEFRKTFPTCGHSESKVIDWLIWRFVDMAEAGAFQSGTFRHV